MTLEEKKQLINDYADKHPHITGAALGRKETAGKLTGEVAAIFYVDKKQDVDPDLRIPSTLEYNGEVLHVDVQDYRSEIMGSSTFPTGSRGSITSTTNVPAATYSGLQTFSGFPPVNSSQNTADNTTVTVTIDGESSEGVISATAGVDTESSYSVTVTLANDIVTTSSSPVRMEGPFGSSGGLTPNVPFGPDGLTDASESAQFPFLRNIEGLSATVGGVTITPTPMQTGVTINCPSNTQGASIPDNVLGTIGFLAIHSESDTLVGVTNNHVINEDNLFEPAVVGLGSQVYYPYSAAARSITGVSLDNSELGSKFTSVQWATPVSTSDNVNTTEVDAALTTVDAGTFNTDSWKPFALDIINTLSSNPPWATAAELDDIEAEVNDGTLANNTALYHTGSRTGPKGLTGFRLRATQVHTLAQTINIDSTRYGRFINHISMQAFNNTDDATFQNPCPGPTNGGDSGSAVYANIGGVLKLAGLIFAGSWRGRTGSFIRIDKVATALGIEHWDTSSVPSPTPLAGTVDTVVVSGEQTDATITRMVGGKSRTYYRVGTTMDPVTP